MVDLSVSFEGSELLLRCFGCGLGNLRSIDLTALEVVEKAGPRLRLWQSSNSDVAHETASESVQPTLSLHDLHVACWRRSFTLFLIRVAWIMLSRCCWVSLSG